MTQQYPGADKPTTQAGSPTEARSDVGPQGTQQAPQPSRQPRPIPHQQSRPGPDDDILLATGQPLSARSAAPARDRSRWADARRAASQRQEAIRRQPGRRAWVPGQHGAWSMLILPPLVGWVVGGVSWKNLLLLPAWWGAYLTYWAWSQWLRTRSPSRRALLLVPLSVYTAWTSVLGLLTLVVAPYLLQFAVVLAPLFAIALWQVWSGHERSLPSGLATTAAASVMAAVTYSLAVDGAGGFLGTQALAGPAAATLPGASPNGELSGWGWMWLVTALTAAYFCGTVPYIKSMIRERYNRRLLAGTVAWHTAVAAATVWLASGGYLSWWHATLWVALAVRSLAVPLTQWHLLRSRHHPLRPGTMGIIEVVFCLLFLATVATW